MATRLVQRHDFGAVRTFLWEGITESDQGDAISVTDYPDKTVQVIGDFTSSGAITMQGSPDGSTWGTLTDVSGNDVVLTDATPVVIGPNPVYIRPFATAGTGVDMDVYLVASR